LRKKCSCFGELAPIVQGLGGSLLTVVAGQPGEPSLSGRLAGSGLGEPLSPHEPIPAPPSRWRDCLGLGMLDRRESEPLDRDAEEQAGLYRLSTASVPASGVVVRCQARRL
jgi:hypothetical protein